MADIPIANHEERIADLELLVSVLAQALLYGCTMPDALVEAVEIVASVREPLPRPRQRIMARSRLETLAGKLGSSILDVGREKVKCRRHPDGERLSNGRCIACFYEASHG